MPPKKAAAGAGAPSVPDHFTASQLITRSSERYTPLRRAAVAINEERYAAREGKAWRKSALKPEERYYLWCCAGGCCMNTLCQAPLDEKTMTIEHVTPRVKSAAGTYDIHNMMVLCGTCNSKKGARRADAVAGYKGVPGSEVQDAYLRGGGYM